MDKIIQIQWTCSTIEEARQVAKLLLEKHLVACVNIAPAIESLFFWEGKCQMETEVKVWLKTTLSCYEQVRDLIQKHASYDLPEITYTVIDGGSEEYLHWLRKETKVE